MMGVCYRLVFLAQESFLFKMQAGECTFFWSTMKDLKESECRHHPRNSSDPDYVRDQVVMIYGWEKLPFATGGIG